MVERTLRVFWGAGLRVERDDDGMGNGAVFSRACFIGSFCFERDDFACFWGFYRSDVALSSQKGRKENVYFVQRADGGEGCFFLFVLFFSPSFWRGREARFWLCSLFTGLNPFIIIVIHLPFAPISNHQSRIFPGIF